MCYIKANRSKYIRFEWASAAVPNTRSSQCQRQTRVRKASSEQRSGAADRPRGLGGWGPPLECVWGKGKGQGGGRCTRAITRWKVAACCLWAEKHCHSPLLCARPIYRTPIVVAPPQANDALNNAELYISVSATCRELSTYIKFVQPFNQNG